MIRATRPRSLTGAVAAVMCLNGAHAASYALLRPLIGTSARWVGLPFGEGQPS